VLAWVSVWSDVQMTCIWSSWCHCHPIISASEKSRTVYPSGTGLPGLSWKKAVKRLLLLLYSINHAWLYKVCCLYLSSKASDVSRSQLKAKAKQIKNTIPQVGICYSRAVKMSGSCSSTSLLSRELISHRTRKYMHWTRRSRPGNISRMLTYNMQDRDGTTAGSCALWKCE